MPQLHGMWRFLSGVMSDSRLQLRRVAWERSAACEVETPANRDPELDRKIPLSLQHVATSHKWVSQSQLNSHQEIHGNGLQGLAIQRQVASYNHSTMWHWGFIMRQSRSYRKTAVSKKRLSQLWPLLLFFFSPCTPFMWKCIIIMVWSSTWAKMPGRGERMQHLGMQRSAQCAFAFRRTTCAMMSPLFISQNQPVMLHSIKRHRITITYVQNALIRTENVRYRLPNELPTIL